MSTILHTYTSKDVIFTYIIAFDGDVEYVYDAFEDTTIPAIMLFTVPHKVKIDPKNEECAIFCKDGDKAKVQSLIPDGRDDMVIRSMGGNRSEPRRRRTTLPPLPSSRR